jgi:hypothetical protein
VYARPTRAAPRIAAEAIKNAIDSGDAFWVLLAGITIAAVARQLHVSRSWASREANAAGTRILIAKVFETNRERTSALFDRKLDLIEDAFEARCTFVVKGVIVDCRRLVRSRCRASAPAGQVLRPITSTSSPR